MRPVRLGIIGARGIANLHVNNIRSGQAGACELVAVADINPQAFNQFPDCESFVSSHKMLQCGKVEAVLVATPHYSHPSLSIEALKAGLHVLVEKPIAVHKADAERMIAAHKNNTLVFAAMFNQRVAPAYVKLRQLITQGELGTIQRINWIITNWFRTDFYYGRGDWRTTWAGEGGGVLLNQCPHQLDLWQWLFGMPERIRAFCHLGKHHKIEIEDEVTAYMEYKNGATGVFITSTGEAPGTNRLEVCGDMGKVVIEDDGFHFTRNERSCIHTLRKCKEMFATPPVWNVEIPIDPMPNQHASILANFCAAIRYKEPLIAPAAEGIHSVELGNAMLLSSLQGKSVELPLDSKAYERKLKQLIRDSNRTPKNENCHAGNSR